MVVFDRGRDALTVRSLRSRRLERRGRRRAIAASLDRRRVGAASLVGWDIRSATCRSALAAFALAVVANAAAAAECGPDKLGTSRVAEVGTKGGLLVGLKTYPAAIPLADHEVILTFDDGPDERTTPLVLKALADQCVRATFFAIGRKLDDQPALARREVEEGHNVANHTYTHPQPTLTFMSDSAARADILKGMIAVERDAYGQDFSAGEPTDLGKLELHAPFFRFPGFADTADLRSWFADNNVAIFGTDLWASDWIPMKPDEELKLDSRPAGEGRARHAAVP